MEAYRRGYVADFCESVKSGGFFVAVAVAVDAFEISPEVEEGFIGGKKLSKMSEVSSFSRTITHGLESSPRLRQLI
jgi:hypothetical protein